MVSKAREIFNDYIPDVWIYTDLVKNDKDRHFGISLYTNNFINSDLCYDELDTQINDPEEITEIACKRLLDDILIN